MHKIGSKKNKKTSETRMIVNSKVMIEQQNHLKQKKENENKLKRFPFTMIKVNEPKKKGIKKRNYESKYTWTSFKYSISKLIAHTSDNHYVLLNKYLYT